MLCDQELTFCDNNQDVCENGATCVSLTEEDGNYRCLCAEGYTGRNCEVQKMVLGGMMNSSSAAKPPSSPKPSPSPTPIVASTEAPTTSNTIEPDTENETVK